MTTTQAHKGRSGPASSPLLAQTLWFGTKWHGEGVAIAQHPGKINVQPEKAGAMRFSGQFVGIYMNINNRQIYVYIKINK